MDREVVADAVRRCRLPKRGEEIVALHADARGARLFRRIACLWKKPDGSQKRIDAPHPGFESGIQEI